MERNLFITTSKVPPLRWHQAFPGAEIVAAAPASVPPGTLVWLHNCLPGSGPAGQRTPGVFYVVMNDEPNDDRGMEALAQGASGYCNAHATPELLQTIASVIRNNGLWVGESLLNRLIGGISARAPAASRQQEHPMLAALTQREREVALCVARGESNKEIARKLDLAERTIKAHLTGIFEKLGVRDRLRLALLLNTEA